MTAGLDPYEQVLHSTTNLKNWLTRKKKTLMENEALANTVLLAAMALHGISLVVFAILTKSQRSFTVWTFVGIAFALILGLFFDCSFHTATLDLMPWTILAATMIGTYFGSNKRDEAGCPATEQYHTTCKMSRDDEAGT